MIQSKTLSLMALCVISLEAQRAHVDYDHACDFSVYKTYHWTAPAEEQPLNQLMMQRLTGFVEEAMGAKRLKLIETGGDLLVRYQMSLTQQEQYTTYADTIGPGWGWGSAFSTTTVNPVLLGTLTVDVIDAKRNRLIFQGVSTLTVSSRPEKNTKRLAKAVNGIFEKYPPR